MSVRNSIRRLIVCGSFAALAGVAIAQPTGVTGYDLIEIRPLEGDLTSEVVAIDDLARMAGGSAVFPNSAIVWVNGWTVILLAPPGYQTPSLTDISNAGVVVGSASPVATPLFYHPFAWTIAGGHPLGMLGGTSTGAVHSVDDQPWPRTASGGYCGGSQDYATMWDGQTVIQMGGARSAIGDINSLGHAVGSAYNQFNVPRPTLWRDGQMIDIGGDPPNQSGGAVAINDLDEIVAHQQGIGVFHWQDNQRTVLPDLGVCSSRVWAINDRGVIVGESNPDPQCRNGRQHATVWERVAQQFAIVDINDLIPRHSGTVLVQAKDINDAGQIAAYGDNVDGDGRGYLVTPYLFEMSDPVPGRAGRQNTVTITGLQPDQRVVLVWGTQEGAQKIRPSCPGGTLLIRDPHALPMVRADENGVATFTMFIPPFARGRTIRMQAIAPCECEISHTVTWTFE